MSVQPPTGPSLPAQEEGRRLPVLRFLLVTILFFYSIVAWVVLLIYLSKKEGAPYYHYLPFRRFLGA